MDGPTRDPPPELHNRGEGGGGVIPEVVSTERFYNTSPSDTFLFLYIWTLSVGAQA